WLYHSRGEVTLYEDDLAEFIHGLILRHGGTRAEDAGPATAFLRAVRQADIHVEVALPHSLGLIHFPDPASFISTARHPSPNFSKVYHAAPIRTAFRTCSSIQTSISSSRKRMFPPRRT